MTIHVTDSDFRQEVLDADIPVLVDFWAPWCGPCVMMAPTLDELSSELDGKVKIVKLNVDENPLTTSQFGIRSLPTMLLFKSGEPADGRIGSGTPKRELSKWLETHAG